MGNHYIIINLPDYTLRIVKDNDTIEEKRIVVGKTERKTPVLTSTFNNIVFNPTWTVPPTIIREDLTPAATKNRGYFAEKGITIYNWKGDTVSVEKWNPAKFNSYRYVQKPGNDNSLGNVKFNFPNHYTVYLHDTNHRDFFVKNYRSLSSGCVRVENPLPLAVYMLHDSIRWPLDSINKLIATAKTKVIGLKEKIRIHQLYWTAWSENNELIFRDDIYNLDSGLYDKLRK
jgi:murein L,D-transpeptidase YcbB/YkuD